MTSEESLERTLDKLFPLSRETNNLEYLNCPDTISGKHNEPNPEGYCSWCGKKISNRSGPYKPAKTSLSELEAYYRYTYDPDFGVENWERY